MSRRHCSPRRWVFMAATCCCAATTIHAGSSAPSQKSANLVTVRGCLEGLVLTTIDEAGIGDGTHRFDLTGDKRMTTLLKDHSGHQEEITGVLKARNANGATMIKEKRIGKGRVYIGGGTNTAPPENAAARSSIDVREVTHLGNRCSTDPPRR